MSLASRLRLARNSLSAFPFHIFQQAEISIFQIRLYLYGSLIRRTDRQVTHLYRISILYMMDHHRFVQHLFERLTIDMELPDLTGSHVYHIGRIAYQAILKGLTDNKLREERLEYVLKAVHMYERKDDKIGSFSGGMKQRIGIALILLHLPRILVVDEPTAGLDPRERIRFRNLLVELSKDRIVIFSTHIIEDISSSCSQVVVINKGELKYFGDPTDMVDMATGKVWQFHIDRESFEPIFLQH